MSNYDSNERLVGIAKDKKLLKEYPGRTVYLNDGDKFQIMLFNPTKSKIGAKIKLNGMQIPNMLVLKPGERVWLDRYLHKNVSFVFSTYEVENSEGAKNAISNNGYVEVSFYREEEHKSYMICDSVKTYPYHYDLDNSEIKPYAAGISQITWQTNHITLDEFDSNSNKSYNIEPSAYYCSTVTDISASNTAASTDVSTSNTAASTIETGRIEEGGRSEQEFSWDNSDFSSFAFKTESLRILPMSMKPISNNDIQKKYCTHCGRKLNPKFKYCPTCGTKIE